MEKQIKGRLTFKSLIEWINTEFIRVGIEDYEVYEIYRTRFASHYYEAGACKLVILFRLKNAKPPLDTGNFTCDYSLKDLNYYLKDGYRLVLKFRHGKARTESMSNLEIDVTKY